MPLAHTFGYGRNRRWAISRPQVRIRTLLIVIAVSALILAGLALALRRNGRPYSTVFANFDPVALFSTPPEFSVQGITGNGSFNLRLGGSFKEWGGFIKTTEGGLVPPMIQAAIEKYLTMECSGSSLVTGNLTYGAIGQPADTQVPSYGRFVFNQGDRHGELHVWLFPDSSGSGVGCAIALQEEPLEWTRRDEGPP